MRATMVATMVVLSGCGNLQSDVGRTDESVVGGQSESGYPAVGYLLAGEQLNGPVCGVTVIGPKAAVTAAHCIYYSGGSTAVFGMGFGNVGSGPAYKASRVWVNPQYDANSSNPPRYHHDVAVLIFDSALPVTPATLGATRSGSSVRYIGYGRTTPGDYNVSTGYTNERKSTGESVTSIDATNVFVTGVGGGLCWGDSGGPLMKDGGSTIYGVLADFNQVFDCEIGNQMIFTSLDAESAFIQKALACGTSIDLNCINQPTCTPVCGGKQCGDDGCGGTCGSCGANQTCTSAGQCQATCTPVCGGKQCGDDGCGHSCGSCGANQTCTSAGQCQTTAGGACAGVSAWDANEQWFNYHTGEQHVGSNHRRYACSNPAFCYLDPAGPYSGYGWTDLGACS